MARVISRAESWEKVHTAFTQINFNAFDYDTVKQSLMDYMKIYYPEDFNDYTESSEFVAILEIFSYVAEILAYRLDMNAHENFITTAERKESVLRLAKLISYKASRNIAARGFVKIQTVRTSEHIIDYNGKNISNTTITWNDPNNPDWKEQFFLIMNRVLEQDIGTVKPTDRVQVSDVLLELYSFNNSPLNSNGITIFSYLADGVPMELVPISLTENGPIEKRPERDMKFSIMYAYDGLGDGSDTTGFLSFTKQGNIKRIERRFDGKTPNQVMEISEFNINETDIWVNNVDSTTKELVHKGPFESLIVHHSDGALRYGEWTEVDSVYGENIIFNSLKNRNKFEVETLTGDNAKLIFGDGEFADIPSGDFDIWYRVSENSGESIQRSEILNETSGFNYTDDLNYNQSFSFTYSLIGSLLNSSSSEEIEQIRRNAPSVYYTQNRMVNGRDYNSFMLQDPSIVKLRSINRTFAGDSKYIAWHDPREYYENVKIFGSDSALYWVEKDPHKGGLAEINKPIIVDHIINNYIEPLLGGSDMFVILSPEMEKNGLDPTYLRTNFSRDPYSFDASQSEIIALTNALESSIKSNFIVNLFYSVKYDEWTVGNHPCNGQNIGDDGVTCQIGDAQDIWCMDVKAILSGSSHSGWEIRWRTKKLIAQSEETKFWNSNTVSNIIDYDSFNATKDNFVVLQANVHSNKYDILQKNYVYKILGMELLDQNLPNAGLPDIHKLSVLPEDTTGDGIPDDLLQLDILDSFYNKIYCWYTTNNLLDETSNELTITLPFGQSYIVDRMDEDLEVYVNDTRYLNSTGDLLLSSAENQSAIVRHKFTFSKNRSPSPIDVIKILVKDWVYFTRENSSDRWKPVITTDEVKVNWALDDPEHEDDMKIKRHNGRYPINFGWFHFVQTYNLIDPAASNIIDTFIITDGYYNSMKRWINGRLSYQPLSPTPLNLRNSYGGMLKSKMISDTVVLQPGIFKILFGEKAIPELRAKLKIIRPAVNSLTDNEVKVRVVNSVKKFFDLRYWEFGEGFFFSELSSAIHADIGPEIDSVVLIPIFSQNQFGDMYQVQSRENEVFIPDITSTSIDVVVEYTPKNTRQNP